MNMMFKRKLPIPQEIKGMYPLTNELAEVKRERDEQIKAVFAGKSDKFLLVIGPCSADSEEPVLDYVNRLKRVQDKVADRIIIIPRIYTNKPRTIGDGYKGMLHQPDPTKGSDLLKGIIAIREVHMRVLEQTGLSSADEMLYTENHRYLSDLLSYVAVGARSVEDQQHRLTASGLDIPVGMKNPTGGDISVMMNSITAAQHPHAFIYRGWEEYAHAILRGYVNKHGQSLPNYHYEDLISLYDTYMERGLKNPAVMVDTNHANSNKDFREQKRIAKEVLQSCRYSGDVKSIVKGLMIESYIEEGCQPVGGGVYGRSITDPCLGWKDTEELIYEIAEEL